jgi:hypothetical protein
MNHAIGDQDTRREKALVASVASDQWEEGWRAGFEAGRTMQRGFNRSMLAVRGDWVPLERGAWIPSGPLVDKVGGPR